MSLGRLSGWNAMYAYQKLLRLSKESVGKRRRKSRTTRELSYKEQVIACEHLLEDVFKVYQRYRDTNPDLSRRAAMLYAEIRDFQTSTAVKVVTGE